MSGGRERRQDPQPRLHIAQAVVQDLHSRG